MLQSGDTAPNFTAVTTAGDTISLSDYLGRNNVVLYFYPEDDTPGCTVEACEFRDAKHDYDAADAVILGVSTDDQEAHQAFTSKYSLNFPLLVDADKTICDLYGVPVRGHQPARMTFLIDTDGVIRKVWEQVDVRSHAADVISQIKAMANS
ncbi:MAG: peroxiredoxin [Bacteroidota bacterium]